MFAGNYKTLFILKTKFIGKCDAIPCPEKIPDIFDSNLKKIIRFLTTGDQMAIQFSTAPIVCFCST